MGLVSINYSERTKHLHHKERRVVMMSQKLIREMLGLVSMLRKNNLKNVELLKIILLVFIDPSH